MLTDIPPVLSVFGLGAVVGSFVTHWLTMRRDRSDDSRKQMRPAAIGLREALTEVRIVVDASPPAGRAEPRKVSEQMTSWGETFDRWEAWLPGHARHIDHSISDAVCTHLGAVGRSHRLRQFVSEPFSDRLDPEWQGKATDYIRYIVRWLDQSGRDGQWGTRPWNFDEWLHADEEHHRALERGELTRLDRILNRLFGGT